MSIAEIIDTMEYGPAPESPAAALQWLETHKRSFGHFIDGTFAAHSADASFDSVNPATGETLAQISQGTEADVNAAVNAARKAQKSWAKDGTARAKVLYALARLIQKHARLLAVLETLDNGKPIRETRDIDVPLVARHFYYHAGWAQLMTREFPDHEPIGVAG